MLFSKEMVDQRRPRMKSGLARHDEGPGSFAMKLLRAVAGDVGKSCLCFGEEGIHLWGNVQRQMTKVFLE